MSGYVDHAWRHAPKAAGGTDPIPDLATLNGHVIEDEGTPVTQRANLNFVGAGVTVTDSSPDTIVTIPGGGSDTSCRVYNNADISIADSTTTALTFNSERFDTSTLHSTATNTGKIYPNAAGKWLVGGNIYFDTHATGYRGIQIYWAGLGGTVIALKYLPAPSAIGTGLNVHAVIDVVANDVASAFYWELRVRQTSGGALNVMSLAAYSPEFWAIRLA